MTRLKKSAKAIWKYRRIIVLIALVNFCIVSTVEAIIDKNYDLAVDKTIIIISAVLIFLQSKTIKNKEELIRKQSKLINQVTKSTKESAEKCVNKSNEKTLI